MKNLLIWGAGDQGVVTLDCAIAMNCYDTINFLAFIEQDHRNIPNHRLYHEQNISLMDFLCHYDEVIIATGNNELREKKAKTLSFVNVSYATLLHPTAFIAPSANIQAGCTILAHAVVHTNANIQTGCIINTGAIVEHDCTIGNFVNICPNVAIAGHTEIGDFSFLGVGCSIINNIHIGRGTIIGAGAVVIHDVPDYTIATGVPARIREV